MLSTEAPPRGSDREPLACAAEGHVRLRCELGTSGTRGPLAVGPTGHICLVFKTRRGWGGGALCSGQRQSGGRQSTLLCGREAFTDDFVFTHGFDDISREPRPPTKFTQGGHCPSASRREGPHALDLTSKKTLLLPSVGHTRRPEPPGRGCRRPLVVVTSRTRTPTGGHLCLRFSSLCTPPCSAGTFRCWQRP